MKPIFIHLSKLSKKPAGKSIGNYEFHVSGKMRNFYDFDKELFSLSGNVIFPNFYAVRLFADKMNKKRDLLNSPEKSVKAGQLNAMGLIDEILHYVVTLYKQDRVKDVFKLAIKYLTEKIGEEELNKSLKIFVTEFPPREVYTNKISVEEYLESEENQEISLEEMMHLFLENANPAFRKFGELFDDSDLSKLSAYRPIMATLEKFFETQPTFGQENQTLFELLITPARRHPNSLTDQLKFMRRQWGLILSKYLMRLYGSLDLISEEEKAIFEGPGPTIVQDFSKQYGTAEGDAGEGEPEQFSPDKDWMPNVVMIAKSTYVWLDQLSKKYKRDIYRLDQIPDEELDMLASRGFTGLWLIGLWERSSASQKIKQIMGNPEAVSSAYSLFDYQIAHDLGGEEACNRLRQRAWQRGIRLASDMVPNHTGIFSKWVLEHPDWFVQNSYPPFPGYTFNGENLSADDSMQIYIEDGYWNHSDAAVVFKRVDKHTGETRYIYHGNDGTNMPWNDTAQLNYLIPEVRQAVIQTILHVARQFPIIRFDAAMTLAKKHFQRLWFPLPGSGGDIPSRAEHAMTKEQFDQVFPVEFWREVVDTVAREVPDTLLLAEAFWMMEGYFVRTLGMHRVYNSAFMNMFKNEENAKYRQSIKNVMDFNPEIMKRYVNFMNNPDEETAVTQFGKDDKYFGVCVVMSTLPGLPMYGHGQIEGYAEKYGMEYRKAYWDEQDDQHLIERHKREIFPLLKKRYIFSETHSFVLYDFINHHGGVNENVYAYTNYSGDEGALVLFNNKFEDADGYIKYSSATAKKEKDQFVQTEVWKELNIQPGDNTFVIYKDLTGGLEYIRHSHELLYEGFKANLGAFKYHVFSNFRSVQDNEYRHYSEINAYLQGRGVPSVEDALKEIFLQPVHHAFREIVNPGFLNYLENIIKRKLSGKDKKNAIKEFEQKALTLFNEIAKYTRKELKVNKAVKAGLPIFTTILEEYKPKKKKTSATAKYLENNKPELPALISGLISYMLGRLFDEEDSGLRSIALSEELLLTRIIRENLKPETAEYQISLMKALNSDINMLAKITEKPLYIRELFTGDETRRFLNVNRYRDLLYFNKERFEAYLGGLFYIYNLRVLAGDTDNHIRKSMNTVNRLTQKAEDCGYRVNEMVNPKKPKKKKAQTKAKAKAEEKAKKKSKGGKKKKE